MQPKLPCRPREHLIAAGRLYPQAWRQVDEFRAARGDGLPDWPDWCYLPLAGAYAIISADAGLDRLPPHLVGDVARLAALAAWRVGQGIYRYDPALYAALIDTPVSGDLPCDILYRLPEWAVYIEMPDRTWLNEPVYGVFAHLEWDVNAERPELRLLFDTESELMPLPLHLGDWPLEEAIARMLDVSKTWAAAYGVRVPDGVREQLRQLAEPALSLLLYLCSEAAEIGAGELRPQRPQPVKTKRGWRLFPADKPTTWDVGVRLGAALRAAYQREQTGRPSVMTGQHVRPHVRRAHWHTYVVGARKREDGSVIPLAERRRELRWLPPIPVAVTDYDDLPAVIRPVRDRDD